MWHAVQCAVQGRGHIKAGVPCQDKTYACNRNGVNVIALADGAGSAKLSHYGAECVTQYICEELSKAFEIYFNESNGVLVKQHLISGVLNELDKMANELNCVQEDLASTLLVAAVKEERFILLHIGDGVVGYLKNNELKIASQPENGEFVNTTIFTTSKDALMTMKIMKGSLGTIEGFVLMSDGTEESLYNKKEKKLADVLMKIMRLSTVISKEKLEEQLKQSFEMVISKATMDDCSIAILMNDYNKFPGYEKLNMYEKRELLKLKSSSKSIKKQIKRFDMILEYLEEGQSLQKVSRDIHLKPKYTKKHLEKLIELNFVERKDLYYYTVIIMER